jgi:hypothetical protein
MKSKLSIYLPKHLLNMVDQGNGVKYLVKSLNRCLPNMLMHCNRNSKLCFNMQWHRFKKIMQRGKATCLPLQAG